MAIRSKTPRTPAPRGGTASGQDTPAKPKTRRTRSPAVEPPAAQSASAPDELMGQAARPHNHKAPAHPVEQPAPQASAEDEGRASRASEAIKASGEMVAAGLDTLAELRAEIREVSRRVDELAAGRAQPAAATSDANDYAFGRDRDPGDAVPPGVAAATPAPLTDNDKAVLHTLEDLPKRAGRGRRGPRAKA